MLILENKKNIEVPINFHSIEYMKTIFNEIPNHKNDPIFFITKANIMIKSKNKQLINFFQGEFINKEDYAYTCCLGFGKENLYFAFCGESAFNKNIYIVKQVLNLALKIYNKTEIVEKNNNVYICLYKNKKDYILIEINKKDFIQNELIEFNKVTQFIEKTINK